MDPHALALAQEIYRAARAEDFLTLGRTSVTWRDQGYHLQTGLVYDQVNLLGYVWLQKIWGQPEAPCRFKTAVERLGHALAALRLEEDHRNHCHQDNEAGVCHYGDEYCPVHYPRHSAGTVARCLAEYGAPIPF